MIREELKLSKARLPEGQVESAWAALDKDKSGFITVNEFGAFMQQGLPEVAAPLCWDWECGEWVRLGGGSVPASIRRLKNASCALRLAGGRASEADMEGAAGGGAGGRGWRAAGRPSVSSTRVCGEVDRSRFIVTATSLGEHS